MLPPIPNSARIGTTTADPVRTGTFRLIVRTVHVGVRTTRRRLVVLAAAVLVAFLLVAVTAAPAGAHGGLENPVSRQAACGPEGGQGSQSEACAAAIALAGGQQLEDWDNVRLPGVGGNDRAAVPDGQLCSAGLEQFAGLDAIRADWPSTTLRSGVPFTFRYRATIPHQGTFRFYVTADGYDPAQPLTWSDLEPEPFLTATDPPLNSGAYTIDGQLPPGKTGPHLIYTVWQNSDTPDTYYSCSDVAFAGASTGGAADGAAPGADPNAADGAAQGADQGAATGAQNPAQDAAATPAPETVASAPAGASSAETASEENVAFPWMLGAAALIVLVMVASSVFRRSRW